MDGLRPDDDLVVATATELLQRARPVPPFAELARLDRRLTALRAPRGFRRRWSGHPRGQWSRLVTAGCLSVGLLFSTAGTGLALSGFATTGPAVRAQYPDSRGPGNTGSGPASPGTTSPGRMRVVPGRQSPSTLSQVRPTDQGVVTPVSIVRAETHGELPFTGFGAIPVLVLGIGLVVVGVLVNRRTRAG